jgi:adenylate kinase family enzyme
MLVRIQIIGYSGSGKSTLAKLLGEFYNIPYLHLDNTHFHGDWIEYSVEEQSKIVRDFLEANDNWVIDGNYTRIAPERFFQSDITIFLSYNRFYCYKMCRRRYIENKGKIRESCPCEEKFDNEFRKWILFDGRTKERHKKLLENLKKSPGQKYIFKNKNELDGWLKSIGVLIKIN